jgi:outer membrane receptor protein involved in Fe transport
MTSIINADLRIEYFPTLRDVLALSFFFKSFKDPIEPVILGDSLTYRNAEGATLLGIELEARRNLEPIAAALKDFSVVSNLTLARSRIEVTPTGTLALTNLSRPLVNQAPWVFNFALDYSLEKTGTTARLLYNIVGPRIVEVGAGGLDDVYEHPRNMLDLTVQQDIVEDLKVKLEAKNLLNSQIYMTQGCSKSGVFGSTWHIRCTNGDDYATSRYTEGVSFNVSGSYDF